MAVVENIILGGKRSWFINSKLFCIKEKRNLVSGKEPENEGAKEKIAAVYGPKARSGFG
jgi:hypothetical protein